VAFSAQPSSSSPYEFGYSNNAALGNSSWGMSSSLFPVPSIQGVDINGVFYQYTANKEAGDPFTVSVQNKYAEGNGYIFRETDDWSGGSGGTIQKFGEGSIDTVGVGSVSDATVLYSYRFDPDRVQPEINIELPVYDVYDALSDSYVNAALAPTDPELYEGDPEEKAGDGEEDDGRLEKALAASENALGIANGVTQAAMLRAMNNVVGMNTYYAASIPGGAYRETVTLSDKNLPDNKRAFRSLGQQKLHTDMVDHQYGK
jgi:hypothetical protein